MKYWFSKIWEYVLKMGPSRDMNIEHKKVVIMPVWISTIMEELPNKMKNFSSSCAMASSHLTCRTNLMDAARNLTSAKPLTARRRPYRGASQKSLWWACRPWEQGIQPHARAWQSKNIHRSLCASREVQKGRFPLKGRGGAEGGSPHQRHLDAGDGQYS